MNIKALFFDIDGTLVSFKTHQIPLSTVQALEWAKLQGIQVYISTGRPQPLIVNLGQIEHLIDGYITTNGALCIVGSHVVSSHCIDQADVRRVLQACDRWDVPCVMVGRRHLGVHRIKPIIEEAFRKGLGLPHLELRSSDQMLGEPILQLTPFVSPAQEAELMPRLQACTSGRWTPAFTDITHVEADKGKGLLAMAAYLGLNIDETVAFGDGGNDISILKRAGIGVAMGNAGDEVKRMADYVTTAVDDDGVSRAIRHLLRPDHDA